VWIQRGGVALAKELAEMLAKEHGWTPQLGTIDVTLYRDDTWLKGRMRWKG